MKYQELEKQKTDAQSKLDDLDKEVRLDPTTSLKQNKIGQFGKFFVISEYIHKQAGDANIFALLLESQVWRNAKGREAEVRWRNKNSEWFSFTIIIYVWAWSSG